MRRALKDQINEFGQTPKQIFFAAHPAQKSKQAVEKEAEFVEQESLAPPIDRKQSVLGKSAPTGPLKFKLDRRGQLEGLQNASVIQFLKNKGQLLIVDGNQLKIFDIEGGAKLKNYGLNSEGVVRVCQVNNHLFVLGLEDGSIVVFSTTFGLTTQTIDAHKNKVTALHFLAAFVG